MVKMLLDKKADINKASNYGCTPLYTASKNGHVEVVKVLLKANVDVNKADNDSETPLHMASIEGNEEVVRLLLDHGADINKANKLERTPLYEAEERTKRAKMEKNTESEKIYSIIVNLISVYSMK